MNIGQVPPFFIWPYALFLLLTRQSMFYMLEVIGKEQLRHQEFYEHVQNSLADTLKNSLDMFSNSIDKDDYGNLTTIAKNSVILYLGGIFLVVLKIYILIRHLNYVIFSLLYYLISMIMNTKDGRLQEDDVQEAAEEVAKE